MTNAMPARIAALLDGVARDHAVRILLAVESGSRAWGFASSDSDWDVRFLFVRPVEAYLRIEPAPDVIETQLIDDIDLNGWDIRKALALLVASNAVVLEWLASPVVYRRDDAACLTLATLAREAAHLPALAWHYDRLARRHWAGTPEGPVRFKTLFYALRAALALLWTRSQGGPPPMHLDGLIAGLDLAPSLLDAIERLRVLKRSATEADTVAAPEGISRFLADALAKPEPRPASLDRSRVLAGADQAFLRLVSPY